jgi:hypothetical protein
MRTIGSLTIGISFGLLAINPLAAVALFILAATLVGTQI